MNGVLWTLIACAILNTLAAEGMRKTPFVTAERALQSWAMVYVLAVVVIVAARGLAEAIF